MRLAHGVKVGHFPETAHCRDRMDDSERLGGHRSAKTKAEGESAHEQRPEMQLQVKGMQPESQPKIMRRGSRSGPFEQPERV